MSLAWNTDDPSLKEHYEGLALEFLERGCIEEDTKFTLAPSTDPKIKLNSRK